MKIWGDIPKVSEVYGKHKSINKTDKTSGVASKKDVVSISNQAKDFQTVMKAIKDLPEVRTEKVQELQDKYDSGTYDVGGNEIADKILKTAFDKKT